MEAAVNDKIEKEIVSLERERTDVRSKIAQHEERLKLIDAQLAILRKVSGVRLDLVVRGSGDNLTLVEDKHWNGESNGKLRPTQGILKLLAARPDGMTEKDIVDQLEHKVLSNSKNKRRLISAMLYQQRQQGKVTKVGKVHKLTAKGGGEN
jgi:hypothetical protein